MIQPKYLKPGDTIGIIAPARKISPKEVEPAIKTFQAWGLHVKLGLYLFEQLDQFAGNDEMRRKDLQQMLDDPSINAIICARGGYGTIRILDSLDFTNFMKNPKWIIGYSDITIFHTHLQQVLNVCSLHATMPINFPVNITENEAIKSLKKALFGEFITYEFLTNPFNRIGNMDGEIVGGNLSIIYSLMGSCSEIDTRNKILFIEDLDEYLYHIDRMMMNLKRGGKLSELKGLIIGGMSDMKDNNVPFGMDAIGIIAKSVAMYNYPICFDFPAGHIELNQAIILGKSAHIEMNSKTITYTQ